MILPTPREPLRHDTDLDPVREALRGLARSSAESRLAEADRHAATLLAEAEQEAERARVEVRARALAEAAVLRDQARREAQHHARTVELEARRRAYEELRERSRAAVRAAMAEDEELLAALETLARDRCGPGARVTRLPGGAGVLARAGDRQVTGAFDALADQEVNRLIAERADPDTDPGPGPGEPS